MCKALGIRNVPVEQLTSLAEMSPKYFNCIIKFLSPFHADHNGTVPSQISFKYVEYIRHRNNVMFELLCTMLGILG